MRKQVPGWNLVILVLLEIMKSLIGNYIFSILASPVSANQHQQQQQVPASSELHRVNQESLRNYAAFRDNMLRHFAMTKMRRRQSASNCLDNEEDDDW